MNFKSFHTITSYYSKCSEEKKKREKDMFCPNLPQFYLLEVVLLTPLHYRTCFGDKKIEAGSILTNVSQVIAPSIDNTFLKRATIITIICVTSLLAMPALD